MEDMKLQLQIYEQEYKSFMRINTFPQYSVHYKDLPSTIIDADARGFASVASTEYDSKTRTHTLYLYKDRNVSKHTAFHEFTHMLDMENYAKRDDREHNEGLSGFTEYHAAQVELMLLLNASNISDPVHFSSDSMLQTICGRMRVQDWMNRHFEIAYDLFNRTDFPVDKKTLDAALGALYNYWGFRSVCELYCTTEINEQKNYDAFLRHIPQMFFFCTNGVMHGWISSEQIEDCITTYMDLFHPLLLKCQNNIRT